MTILLPFVLLGPVMLLVSVVLALGRHGPLGWVAAAGLVAAVAWASRRLVRLGLAWWATTKVPRQF